MHTTKQLIILILITAFVFFVFGFFIAKIPNNGSVKRGIGRQNAPNTYQAGWDAARKKLSESGMFVSPGKVKSLNGVVEKITGNKIIIKTNLLNPLDDDSLKTRVVAVGKDTKIVIQKQKTEKEINIEKAAREKKKEELLKQKNANMTKDEKSVLDMKIADLDMPVDLLKQVQGSIKDIKPGDDISVEAANDISEKKEFNAIKITINQMSLSSAPAPASVSPTSAPAPAPSN